MHFAQSLQAYWLLLTMQLRKKFFPFALNTIWKKMWQLSYLIASLVISSQCNLSKLIRLMSKQHSVLELNRCSCSPVRWRWETQSTQSRWCAKGKQRSGCCLCSASTQRQSIERYTNNADLKTHTNTISSGTDVMWTTSGCLSYHSYDDRLCFLASSACDTIITSVSLSPCHKHAATHPHTAGLSADVTDRGKHAADPLHIQHMR